MSSNLEELRALARAHPLISDKLRRAADELEDYKKKVELYDIFHGEVSNAAHKTTITQIDNAIETLEKGLWGEA